MYKLKFTKAAIPEHRLPFVGKRLDKSPGYSFWAVPKTGGYVGGCITGESLANIYMKHILEHGRRPGGMLQTIVLDMLSEQDSDENSSLKGQVVGFFSEIEKYLSGAAPAYRKHLNNIDTKKILQSANCGLMEVEYL